MELSFKIAFGMLLLVGFLHANPIPTCDYEDDLDDIENITCPENMTFTTPTNIQSQFYNASLDTFINGLLRARESCSGDMGTVKGTLAVLEQAKRWCLANAGEQASERSWERKEFDSFVKAIRPFIQQLRN